MRLITTTVLILGACSLVPALRAADDACALLTQARVGEILGVKVGPGQHASETPNGRKMCTWSEPGAAPTTGKRASIAIFAPMGKMTPAERYENAKKPAKGIAKTPVSGIGNDAFLVVNTLATQLYVKKGESVIQVHVAGAPPADLEPLEKALARDAVTRL